MTYRLAFIRTKDSYLKITAAAKGKGLLRAIHVNPNVFIAVSRLADISESDIEDLKSMADKAWTNEGLDICCEAIELEPEQLNQIGFVDESRRFG